MKIEHLPQASKPNLFAKSNKNNNQIEPNSNVSTPANSQVPDIQPNKPPLKPTLKSSNKQPFDVENSKIDDNSEDPNQNKPDAQDISNLSI